jgi:hypothetical protein
MIVMGLSGALSALQILASQSTRGMTRGVHLAPIVSDEQQDERVV